MHKSPKTVRIHEENEIIQVTKIGEESIIENITNDEAKNTCIDTQNDHIDAIEEEQLEDKFLEGTNFITKNRGSKNINYEREGGIVFPYKIALNLSKPFLKIVSLSVQPFMISFEKYSQLTTQPREGGWGHWSVNYTGTQRFMIMFSYLFA